MSYVLVIIMSTGVYMQNFSGATACYDAKSQLEALLKKDVKVLCVKG